MWFTGAGGGGLRNLCRAAATYNNEMSNSSLFVRFMSRKRAENVRRINPKVPIREAYAISNDLYYLLQGHGPLTVPNTWLRAQEAGINGVNSKSHLKLLLKWMRGKKMVKLICNHVGSNKKFLYTILPDDREQKTPIAATATATATESSNIQASKKSRK